MLQVDYHEEFRFVSIKHIFAPHEIVEDEIKLWTYYLERQKLELKDPSYIFLPQTGDDEERNSNVGTDNIRIIRWEWTYNQRCHKLMDMSTRLDDYDEVGIISIDGVPVAHNRNTDLHIINGVYPDCSAFCSRINYFAILRTNLRKEGRSFYTPGIKEFRDSENGQQAIELCKRSEDFFELRLENVEKEQCRLRDLYLSEFTFMFTKHDGVYYRSRKESYGPTIKEWTVDTVIGKENIALRIGYYPKRDSNNKLDTHISYKFIK